MREISEKHMEQLKEINAHMDELSDSKETWRERLDRWTQTIDTFFYTGGDSYYCYAPARTPRKPDETDRIMDTCSEDGKMVSCLLATVTIHTDGDHTSITFGIVPERCGSEVDDFEIFIKTSSLELFNQAWSVADLAKHAEGTAACIVLKTISDNNIEPDGVFKALMIALVARMLFVLNVCYFEEEAGDV